jgi:hypothetical protein
VTDAIWAAFAAVRSALAGLGIEPSTNDGGPFRAVHDPRAAAADAIRTAIGRAGALVRHEIQPAKDAPFYRGELSRGAPRPPAGPLLPRLVELQGHDPALDRLLVATERLAVALVYEADCQEYVDARNTSIALLYAAGAVIAVEKDVVALATSLPLG